MGQSELTTGSNIEEEIHKTKNRIVAVDILRVMAALAVMYEHMVGHGAVTQTICKIAEFLLMPGTAYNCVFFLLAGYFACRNITWKKALDNAWWSFAPFMLWNAEAILLKVAGGALAWSQLTDFGEVARLFGFADPVAMVENGADIGRCFPCNYPLWFMRDLVFLFLLSPILFRFAKWVFPGLVLFAVFPLTSGYLAEFSAIPLFLNSLLFFVAGCFLRTFPKEVQTQMLKFHSGKLILIYMVLWVGGMVLRCTDSPFASGMKVFHVPALNSLLFIWILYQTARWLEVHSSWVSRMALKLAPVTFLTFATLAIIFGIIGSLCPFVYESAVLSVVLPLVWFAILTGVFGLMKRYTRPLLHLVAHYKLRPDDKKPGQGK